MPVQDISQTFPPDLLGKFEIVHIQKLITIVYDNNPGP